MPVTPAEAQLPRDAVHDNAMAARLSACEKRLDGFESQASYVRKLEDELSALRQVIDERSIVETQRFHQLEGKAQQSHVHETQLQDQLVSLQAEFQQFTTQTLSRQLADHVDMEGQVSTALARQIHSTEEWRLAIKQKDAQVQSDLEMLNASLEDMREKLLTSQAELRVRLTALEVPTKADGLGRSVDLGGGFAAQEIDFLKQHLSRLQQGSVQSRATLSEIQARLEGESATRAAAQQEQSTRLEALSQALGFSRALMAQSIAQRVEALEERMGMERKELYARQNRLRDEVTTEGQEGSARLQEVSSRFHSAVESLERRCQTLEAAKEEIQLRLAETQKSGRGDVDALKGALMSTTRKSQEQFERQADSLRKVRAEVDSGLRHMRDLVSSEHRARIQDEKRLCDEIAEATKQAMSTTKSELQSLLKKQAEAVAIDVERVRRVNADRADRLSRYVDAALKDAGILKQGDGGSEKDAAADARLLRDLNEQLGALQRDVAQQAQAFEHRSAELAEELRSKLQRGAESQKEEAKLFRREAEKVAQDSERRTVARQDELEGRLETYVRHFDNSINAVQAAVLRPWREPDPGLGSRYSSGTPSQAAALPLGRRPEAAVAVPPLAWAQDGRGQDARNSQVTEQVLADLWRRLATSEVNR